MNKTVRVPKCPKCGGIMIFTMCFPYKEYACLPCDETEDFFCIKEAVSEEEHDRLKELWSDDTHALAVQNGAGCSIPKGECSICNDLKNYKFKYYGRTK